MFVVLRKIFQRFLNRNFNATSDFDLVVFRMSDYAITIILLAKKHKNLKPPKERKTFGQKRRIALVGNNCMLVFHAIALKTLKALELRGLQ